MILPEKPDATVVPLLNRLRRWRVLARLVLGFERIWPAIWPPLGVVGVFATFALLDVPRRLPGTLHLAILVAASVLTLGLLGRGLWRLRWPDRAAADRRLEQATGLRHRPLATIADRAAIGGANPLWAAHIARAAGQISRLRVGIPRPGLAARDPIALRAAVLLGLFAGLIIAGEQTPGRLWRAVTPSLVPVVSAPATQIQAWITPPDFTGLAPIFLKPDSAALAVPAGSQLTINLTAVSGTPTLEIAGPEKPEFRPLDTTSFQADATIAATGLIRVRVGGGLLAQWDITAIPDAPPQVSFPEPPGAMRGRLPSTRLPWQVTHAYGVEHLQADLRLHDRPGKSPPLVIEIPLPGANPKTAKGARLQDLTAHPWAGLEVDATLVARAVSGLVGSSADARLTLPERAFQHPMARALISVRKVLSLKPDDRVGAVRDLERLGAVREAWENEAGGYLNLRAIIALLPKPGDAVVDDAQARLWALALQLEEGAPDRTARELARAEQALREALDAEKRGEQPDKAELDKRAQAVQEALKQHLQALAEQARRNPESNKFDPNEHRLDAQEMRKLAEQLREATAQERLDEAREKLAELEKRLQEMRDGKMARGKQTERERQRAEKRQQGQQQMSVLGDIVKREGVLLDHAQSRGDAVQSQFRRSTPQGRQGFQPPASAEQRQALEAARTAQRAADGPIQQALRRVLGILMETQAELTGQVPENLGEASTAMREAVRAIGAGDDAASAVAAQKAIAALQKGGKEMSQQMAQQFGQGQGQDGEDGDEDGEPTDMAGNQDGDGEDGQGDGQGQNGMGRNDQYGPGNNFNNRRGRGRGMDRRAENRRDPLGRSLDNGTGGTDESDGVKVPDEMEQARTRAIQEELRRRGGERSRPQMELDYIERLLRQF